MNENIIAVISVTKQGDEISKRLSKFFKVDLFSKWKINEFSLKDITENAMKNYKSIIFISSTGIAVRAIAPFIKSKLSDPGVLVIDASSKFVISLLSGHLGGANALTLKIAKKLSIQPVITTATDNLGIKAPDVIAKERKLVIDDISEVKKISSKLVQGKRIAFIDERKIINVPKGYIKETNNAEGRVVVTNKAIIDKSNMDTLKLIRKDIVLGIGCRKNYDSIKMKENVLMILKKYNIDFRSVTIIATVELKKDEIAIKNLAKFLESNIKIFTLKEIQSIEHKYKGSEFVKKSIGVKAVCEPCVELSKGENITKKIKCDGMTICIGELKCENLEE